MFEMRLFLLGRLLPLSFVPSIFSKFRRQGLQAVEERDIVLH